jgi:hypothetical protein
MRKTMILSGCILFLCGSALADWDPGDGFKMHAPQLPDLSPSGLDVRAGGTEPMPPNGPQIITPIKKIIADDFLCTNRGPITDIHIWGSWNQDVLPTPGEPTFLPLAGDPGLAQFTLGIWSDIPKPAGGGFSMPGQLLWERTFFPGDFAVREVNSPPEGWYNPNTGVYEPENHVGAYQYNFLIDPAIAFVQQGTPQDPVVYWLAVDATSMGETYLNGAAPLAGPQQVEILNGSIISPEFGWKTTHPDNNWNDDATFSDWMWDGNAWVPFQTPWTEMRYPVGHPFELLNDNSINMAFVITPEPTTLIMLGMGAAAMLKRRRQKS